MNAFRTASLLLSLTCATFAYAGTKEVPPVVSPPNWGQVDLDTSWSCPLTYPYNPNDGGQPVYTVMPVALSLTTTGGPVQLTLTMTSVDGNSGGTIRVSPMLDNAPTGRVVSWRTYSGAASEGTVMRIIPVPAGTHTFGAMIACINSGDVHTVTGAWLGAYELPSVVR